MTIMPVKPVSRIETLSGRGEKRLLEGKNGSNIRRLEISVKMAHCQDDRIYRIKKDEHITVN